MSTTHPPEGHYPEMQTPSVRQKETVDALTNKTKKLLWATTVSLAAIVGGINMKSCANKAVDHFKREPTSSTRIGMQYKDDEHARILAGDEQTIDSLGAFDHPGFHGREDKIYDELVRIYYFSNHQPINGEQLDLALMAKVRKAIASHETEVLWLWMDYVQSIQEYCEANPKLNAQGKLVPMYFERVPSVIQRKLIGESVKKIGLHQIVKDTISENENNAQAPSDNVDDASPFTPYGYDRNVPVVPFPLAP